MKQRLTGHILQHYRCRYKCAKRKKKAEILDHVCEMYEYSRKSATRLLNGIEKDTYGKPKPGRQPKYSSPKLLEALQKIWLATDQMGSKRLEAAIALWLPYYESSYGKLESETKQQLLAIRSATIDRLLKPVRVKTGRRGLSCPTDEHV